MDKTTQHEHFQQNCWIFFFLLCYSNSGILFRAWNELPLKKPLKGVLLPAVSPDKHSCAQEEEQGTMASEASTNHWSPGQSTRNILLIAGLIISLIAGTLSQGGTPVQYNIMEEEPGGTILGDIATDAGISDLEPRMTFTITNPQGGGSPSNLE